MKEEVTGKIDSEEITFPFSLCSLYLATKKKRAEEILEFKSPCCDNCSEISLNRFHELVPTKITCPCCFSPLLLNKFYKSQNGKKILCAKIEIDKEEMRWSAAREEMYGKYPKYQIAKDNLCLRKSTHPLKDANAKVFLPCCSEPCIINTSKIKECKEKKITCPFCNKSICIVKRNSYTENTFRLSIFIDKDMIGNLCVWEEVNAFKAM